MSFLRALHCIKWGGFWRGRTTHGNVLWGEAELETLHWCGTWQLYGLQNSFIHTHDLDGKYSWSSVLLDTPAPWKRVSWEWRCSACVRPQGTWAEKYLSDCPDCQLLPPFSLHCNSLPCLCSHTVTWFFCLDWSGKSYVVDFLVSARKAPSSWGSVLSS